MNRLKRSLAAGALTLLAALALGCAAKTSTTTTPKEAPAPPPSTLDLTLTAEVPQTAAVLSISHDGSLGKMAGEPVTFTSKAVVPPGHKLQVNVVGTGWTVPLAAAGKDTWGSAATVPSDIRTGSYNVQAQLLDPSGAEISQALAKDAIQIKPAKGPCELLTDTLAEIRVPFDYDDSSLGADAKAKLEQVVAAIKNSGLATYELTIEGHCDARGTTKYNTALGQRRANTVRQYVATLGLIDAKSIKAVSYGKEKPLVQGDDEAAHAANRRAEFKIACSAR